MEGTQKCDQCWNTERFLTEYLANPHAVMLTLIRLGFHYTKWDDVKLNLDVTPDGSMVMFPLCLLREGMQLKAIRQGAEDDMLEEIKERGQIEPIEIDRQGVIVDGYRRYRALAKLGYILVKVHVTSINNPALYNKVSL
jgi:hypothetical protein